MHPIFSYIKSFIFIFGLLFASLATGQDFSNKGREFWVGYGSHVSMYNANGTVNTTSGGSQNMVLYFTSDQNANVTVEIPATGWSRTYTVLANQVTTTDIIPKTGADDTRLSDEGKSNKGIHIISDVGIIAYTHIYNSAVSGASLLFPVSTLGRDYYSVNYTQVSNSRYSYGYTYVIATEDNTNIEIIPSVNTFNIPKGDTLRVTLNRGEIYNVFGKVVVPGTATNQRSTGEDLTGTRIRSIATSTSSCKRIAVFSGSGKLSINCTTNGAGSADNYIQQAFPSSAWGRKYLTIPTNKMADDLKRSGGFIPGVKPGVETADFLDRIMSLITFPGSLFLALIAVFPAIVVSLDVQQSWAMFYGGTSLIIMVGVAIDTIQQINSYLLNKHYDGLMKSGKNRKAVA